MWDVPESSFCPNLKAVEGFAHRFPPTYAGANVGHPCGSVGPAAGLRVRAVVSHISRKTSEMWGTRRSMRGKNLKLVSFRKIHPAIGAGREPKACFIPEDSPGGWCGGSARKRVSLVFREMWEVPESSFCPNLKAVEGFAHRFRPTYADANVGHPCSSVGPAAGLRVRAVVSRRSVRRT
jgi:hypothetical protein